MKDLFAGKVVYRAVPLAPDEQKERTIDEIMGVVAQIMTKAYGLPKDDMAYNIDGDHYDYVISFSHESAAAIKDRDAALNKHLGFYQTMRKFLQDLEDLSPDLDIAPNELVIHADSLMNVVDALDLYFKDEHSPLKDADTVAQHLSMAKESGDAVEKLANAGYALAQHDASQHVYHFASSPAQPFTSIQHYFASIAGREKSDIPISLDLLRREISQFESGSSPYVEEKSPVCHGAAHEDLENISSWYDNPPELPGSASPKPALMTEMNAQLIMCVQMLLANNYGLARELVGGHIKANFTVSTNGSYNMTFYCPAVENSKDFAGYFEKFHDFIMNIKDSPYLDKRVQLMATRDYTLLKLNYSPAALTRVLKYLIWEKHPENEGAMSHLRAVDQIKDRLAQPLMAANLH